MRLSVSSAWQAPRAHRLPRPPAARRGRHDRRSATSPRRTSTATCEAAEAAGIAELGVSEHIYRFTAGARASGATRSGRSRRATTSTPTASSSRATPLRLGIEMRLRPRRRGPDRHPARRARLRLRGRLGPLRRRPRPSTTRAGTSGSATATPTRSGAATSRRSPRRRAAGLFDILAHPDLVKVWGRGRPAARARPALLLRARGRGDRRGRGRGRGLDRRAAQAGRRALPGAGASPRCASRRAPPSRSPPTPTCPRTSATPTSAPSRRCASWGVERDLRLRAAASAAWSRSADGARVGIGYDSHRFAAGRPAGPRRGRDRARARASRATPTPTSSPTR